MVKGRISSSSKESAPSEVTIRRVSESQRLRIIANKVSVVLNSGDFLSDIDMCEEIDSCDVENDAASFRRGIGQKANGSVDSTKGHNNLEDNGLELPSNGFSPVSFYGPRKQHFTSGVNIFSPNTHKISTDKLGDTISRNSPGVKRKGTKQSSSSMVKKKRKTFTVTRQCKSNGHKNKHALTIIENYSHICVKESMIREPSDVRNATENKKEEDFCQSVTNGVQGSCGEGISSINLGDESGAASASDSSPHGSEGSISSPISGKAFCCNPSESESVCSEMSLHSGPGSVRDNLFLRKNGSEYFFTNSTESEDNSPTEQLTSHQISENSPLESTINSLLIPRPSCTHKSGKDLIIDSQSSLSCSLPSPSTSESDTTVKLSERDTDSCSSKSSPERQVPITRYFKSMTGAKHRLKPTANGITSPRMSLAENSSDIKNSRVSPPKGKKSGKKQEQMYLDLGQKDFGHVTCPTCGMVYTRAQPDDEAAHIRHHKSFVSGLRFTGWKNECVIKEFHDGRVIMVGPDDHPLHLKKVEEVRKVVDSELGFVADVPCVKSEAKTFLFISARKVVGCAVAVQIDQGYPVLPSPGESSTPEKKIAAWCCSTTPQSAQCGISRIWVHSQHRRKKVATRLLDCVRMNIIYGCIIPRDLVAFSDPTPDGKRLAKSYAGTSQFLVFR